MVPEMLPSVDASAPTISTSSTEVPVVKRSSFNGQDDLMARQFIHAQQSIAEDDLHNMKDFLQSVGLGGYYDKFIECGIER